MISPHRYSGRHLPRGHTSYSALAFMVMMSGALLLQVTTGAMAGQLTDNGSVNLTGVFAGQAPSTAPQIVQPSNGAILTAIPVEVRGSCGVGLVVEIFKNGLLAGSANCQADGSFRLMVDLFEGRNDLIARQYDSFNQGSADSSVVAVFYNPPSRLSSGSLAGKGGGAVLVPPKAAQLILKSEVAFKGIDDGAEVSWPVEIVGGRGPYAVGYDWGDGQSSLVSVASTGGVSSKHIYKSGGNYSVVIKVTDAGGQQAYIQVLTLVSGSAPVTAANRHFDTGSLLIAWPLFALLVFMLGSFWLGERFEVQKLNRDFKLGL